MAKIYTKTGDQGETSLVGGRRVSKSHIRLDAYGTVDELNCCLGVAGAELAPLVEVHEGYEWAKVLKEDVEKIQNNLFNLGSQLACEDPGLSHKLPAIDKESILNLESTIDEYEKDLPPLNNFILPGGSRIAAYFQQARAVCRRAERHTVFLKDEEETLSDSMVMYLNRLSDLLFILARYVNFQLKRPEIEWNKTSAEKT